MPTALQRIQVTKTPPVERALEIAAREWPGVPRSELITRLVMVGAEHLAAAHSERRRMRRDALQQLRGSIDYPSGYLAELREDWPE